MGLLLLVPLLVVLSPWAEGRSEGLAISDELDKRGAIIMAKDMAEFGTLRGVPPGLTGVQLTTIQAYPAAPVIFPSLLRRSAMPLAPRLRDFVRNPNGTWTVTLFLPLPWCHSSLASTIPSQDVHWLALAPTVNASASAGGILEVGTFSGTSPETLSPLGGTWQFQPQTTLDDNVALLLQLQSYDKSPFPYTPLACQTSTCPSPSGDTSCCRSSAGGGSAVCLPCDPTKPGDATYDWMVTRGVIAKPDLRVAVQCARGVDCSDMNETVGYALFKTGLREATSATLGDGYYVWGGKLGQVTALPARLNHTSGMGLTTSLAQTLVFGTLDMAGDDPSQPRVGEQYSNFVELGIVEDNCHGTGDVSHDEASNVFLVVLAWNDTTTTRVYRTPTSTFTPTVSLTPTTTPSITPTMSLSPTATKSLTQTMSLTTVPMCTVFLSSTLCRERSTPIRVELWWALYAALPCCLGAGAAVALLFGRRKQQPLTTPDEAPEPFEGLAPRPTFRPPPPAQQHRSEPYPNYEPYPNQYFPPPPPQHTTNTFYNNIASAPIPRETFVPHSTRTAVEPAPDITVTIKNTRELSGS